MTREGKFNTSFHIGRPGIHPDTMDTIILDWHQKLQGVVFVSGDFTETLRTVTDEDFVYLDPPYFHTKGMYGETFESSRLFECLEHLNRIGVRWMLSYDGSPEMETIQWIYPRTCTDGMSISSPVFPHSKGS